MIGDRSVEPVIALERLEKRYGRVRALNELTLAIPPGPVGLLGPNGAGKSTLLKLLLGLLAPDGGRARIAGLDPTRRADRLALRARVGYMPEGDCLVPGMNAVGVVELLARLSGLARRDALTRAHEVLDYVGLGEARYRDVGEYSTGMKQRLKLAQALAHDPPLCLLDEPTSGLDPKGRVHMLDLIRDLGHAQGKSLLLCSHLLPDVERTCREVVVLAKGQVLASGPLEELTRREERWMRVEVSGDRERFLAALARQRRAFELEERGSVRVALAAKTSPASPSGAADEVFALAHASGAVVTSLAPVRSSLEDVFLESLRGSEAG